MAERHMTGLGRLLTNARGECYVHDEYGTRAALLLVGCLAGLFEQTIQSTTAVATNVSRLVRISGCFRPANSLPAAPVESVTLSIYREEHGGDPLWQDIQNVNVAADGNDTVLLGASLLKGVPLDLFTSGEPRWLALQFNRPGEAEQPRTQLVSVRRR